MFRRLKIVPKMSLASSAALSLGREGVVVVEGRLLMGGSEEESGRVEVLRVEEVDVGRSVARVQRRE